MRASRLYFQLVTYRWEMQQWDSTVAPGWRRPSPTIVPFWTRTGMPVFLFKKRTANSMQVCPICIRPCGPVRLKCMLISSCSLFVLCGKGALHGRHCSWGVSTTTISHLWRRLQKACFIAVLLWHSRQWTCSTAWWHFKISPLPHDHYLIYCLRYWY